jgi:hypothetical protein
LELATTALTIEPGGIQKPPRMTEFVRCIRRYRRNVLGNKVLLQSFPASKRESPGKNIIWTVRNVFEGITEYPRYLANNIYA